VRSFWFILLPPLAIALVLPRPTRESGPFISPVLCGFHSFFPFSSGCSPVQTNYRQRPLHRGATRWYPTKHLWTRLGTNILIHTFQCCETRGRYEGININQPVEFSPKASSGRKFEGEGFKLQQPHEGDSYENWTKLVAILYRRSFPVRATTHCSRVPVSED